MSRIHQPQLSAEMSHGRRAFVPHWFHKGGVPTGADRFWSLPSESLRLKGSEVAAIGSRWYRRRLESTLTTQRSEVQILPRY